MRRSEAGFTLIETLIGLLLLSFGLVAVLQSFSYAAKTMSAADTLRLAKVRLEHVQSMAELSAYQRGPNEGRFSDGWTWQFDVQPVGQGLWEVRSRVVDLRNKDHRLNTLRFDWELGRHEDGA
ncbi:MAG: type IV pilus modification PilV family protein [Henriciella sp.]|jgi:type II secretory pathway pseudopilin PulG